MNITIPNFEDMQVVDKEGNWTPAWKNIMQLLINMLQQNLGEGVQLTKLTAAEIAVINNIKSNGKVVYNLDTNKVNVNINGTFKEVITT